MKKKSKKKVLRKKNSSSKSKEYKEFLRTLGYEEHVNRQFYKLLLQAYVNVDRFAYCNALIYKNIGFEKCDDCNSLYDDCECEKCDECGYNRCLCHVPDFNDFRNIVINEAIENLPLHNLINFRDEIKRIFDDPSPIIIKDLKILTDTILSRKS